VQGGVKAPVLGLFFKKQAENRIVLGLKVNKQAEGTLSRETSLTIHFVNLKGPCGQTVFLFAPGSF